MIDDDSVVDAEIESSLRATSRDTGSAFSGRGVTAHDGARDMTDEYEWPCPETEMLHRDIVYFYEVQAGYNTIEVDINFSLFKMNYWEYLSMPTASPDHFIERGCLAIITAGALAMGGNMWIAFGPTPLEVCRSAVKAARYSDSTTEQLRQIAAHALDLASVESSERDYELIGSFPDVEVVYRLTARAYFLERARRIDPASFTAPAPRAP